MGDQIIGAALSSGRNLAYAGLFGAAALALPMLFHLVHLGHVFMPMYIPLMALPFFVGWEMAGLTALVIPLLSALTTGMPPLMPPVAPVMSLEIGIMAGLLAILRARWPAAHPLLLLTPVLLLGRVLNGGFMYLAARLFDLPAAITAGISLLSGWPGILLMLIVIPPIARLFRRTHA